jgi:hypothetical protein
LDRRRRSGAGGPGCFADLGEDAPHFFRIERPESLSPDGPAHSDAQADSRGRLFVRRLHDADEVIVALRPEVRVYPAAHLLDHLPGLLGALSGLRDAADPVPSS